MTNQRKGNQKKGQGKAKGNTNKPKPRPKTNARPRTVSSRMATAGKAINSAVASVSTQHSASKSIAYALANPSAVPNLRIALAGDSVPTAVTSLHEFQTYKVSSVGVNYPEVELGSMAIALFRDPLRHMIKYVANPNRADMYYEAKFAKVDLDITGAVAEWITPLWFFSTALQGSADFCPHGPVLYLGKHTEKPQARFVWMDVGTELIVNMTEPQVGDYIMPYEAVDQNQVTDLTAITALSVTQFHFVAPHAGYFALEYHPFSAHVTRKISSMSYESVVGFGDCWGHTALPGVGDHLTHLKKIRVDAASILISPTASLLNNSGTIHAIYSTETVNWKNYLNKEMTAQQSGQMDYLYSRKSYKDGMYGFVKPSGAEDLAWRMEISRDTSSEVNDIYYYLNSNAGHLLFWIDTSSTGDVAAGAMVELTTFTNLEWVPLGQAWMEVHLPPASFTSLATQEAFDVIKYMPTFYENPMHLSDIRSGIGKAARFAYGNRKAISGLLASLFPQFRGALAVGNRALDVFG